MIKKIDNRSIEEKYNELLYQVREKFPIETTHETALRMLKNVNENRITTGKEVNNVKYFF